MALAQYQYPVDLTRFTGALEDQNWFNVRIEPGDRLQTMEFEARFREHARFHLKAWGEVVFWKLYTIGIARNKTTQQVLDLGVSPDELWSACTDYIENGSKESFEALRRKLFRSGVAVAATFPAFICPERFPLVDRQVTRWASKNGHLATSFIRDGCGLPTPPFGSRGGARPTPGRPRCACRALRGQAAAAGSGSAARSPGAVAPR